MKRVHLRQSNDLADLEIKSLNLSCKGIPVARDIIQGSYGFLPYLDKFPATILERSAFYLPIVSFFGINRPIMLLFVDKDDVIFDTRIYNGGIKKLIISWVIPDLIIELDMDALSLINPTIIGKKVGLSFYEKSDGD